MAEDGKRFEDLTPGAENKLIIGFDFGTTYCGIGYAESSRLQRNAARGFSQWPGTQQHTITSDKVPTKIRYDGPKPQWGFLIPSGLPSSQVMDLFKLDLEPSLYKLDAVSDPTAPRRSPQETDKLMTDYMTELVTYVMTRLRADLKAEVIDAVPIQVVLTVPAIWTDLAKEKTRAACHKAFRSVCAGALEIKTLSEPEAAAIFALHTMDRADLGQGDAFVVCDAGGGTVDLISYVVNSLAPILDVVEAAPGSGGLCGSVFLNKLFEKFLQARYSHLQGYEPKWVDEVMDMFERTLKREMNTALTQGTYTLRVGGLANDAAVGSKAGKIVIPGRDLFDVFEPIIQEIQRLVQAQIRASDRTIKAVLLVGGFGTSTYLRERLTNQLQAQGIKVLQVEGAWRAVVSGAVLKGLAWNSPDYRDAMPRIGARRARKHHGFEIEMPYVAELHGAFEGRRFWSGMDGCHMLHAMSWFLRYDEHIVENHAIPHYFSVRSHARIAAIDLIIFTDALSATREAPLVRDHNVVLVCQVRADLSQIPDDQITQRRGADGKQYYEISAHVEALYETELAMYTLVHEGKRYDTVTVKFS
ncbi:hypothetical protein P8C59_005759 [Phyllachora maydis]|uniref:Actin-like ATPase domain-containing protein n=1 Tax=Phyllachora maydis TaxID=1825666 RepID=A0AAD9MDU4_9PEZI|nr:hypothetical protein P8C59_005759 [Phyllachora maydis]